MSKELIEKLREDGKFLSGNFGKLMHEAADALEFKVAQYIAGVGRAIDDCARLPVVAAAKALCKHHADLCGVNADDQWTHYSEDFLADVQIVMPHLQADAKSRLAEKNARIAQLAAHARGKNKALANALKEIERLKRTIEAGAENEIALVGERTELRAQLEKLQSGRGAVVVLPERMSKEACSTVREYELCDMWNNCIKEVARLNPAPAAAAQPWIPVSERLPDEDVPVFGWCPCDSLDADEGVVLILSQHNSFFTDDFHELYEPTHWMPLPAAPATADSDVREVK